MERNNTRQQPYGAYDISGDVTTRPLKYRSVYYRRSSMPFMMQRPMNPRGRAQRAEVTSATSRSLKIAIIVALVVVLLGGSWLISNSTSGPSDRSVSDPFVEKTTSTPRSEWQRGIVPVLYQIDDAWASTSYAGDTLRTSGCGPTCMTMVYICLTGKTDMDPAKMCSFSEDRGYVSEGMTTWDLMTTGASELGLSSEVLPADEGMVKASIAAGRPVIASVGPGIFTTSGHFIVLCGLDGDGNVIIHDPNSPERTKRSWDLGEILTQVRNLWAFSRAL